MSDFKQEAKSLYVVIQASREVGALADLLHSLTDYAELLVKFDHKTEAANLLAFVLNHADVPFEIYDRADDLFIALESELCPRVIADARESARFMTVRGVVESAFKLLNDENPSTE